MSRSRDSDRTQLFVDATLQLLEDQSQQELVVARLLPALRILADEESHSRAQVQSAKERVAEWLGEHDNRRSQLFPSVSQPSAALSSDVAAQPFSHGAGPAMSGWLRKWSRTRFRSRRRWVVLDGSSLLYFDDRAETHLRGVLHLQGIFCRVAGGITTRKPTFEIMGANRTRPGRSADVLNPFHLEKRVYRWVADTEEERDRWVAAIQEAARLPDPAATERRPSLEEQASVEPPQLFMPAKCLAWGRAIASATSPASYRRALAALIAASLPPHATRARRFWARGCDPPQLPAAPQLVMEADWARLHMNAVRQKEREGEGTEETNRTSPRDRLSRAFTWRSLSQGASEASSSAPAPPSATSPHRRGTRSEVPSMEALGVRQGSDGRLSLTLSPKLPLNPQLRGVREGEEAAAAMRAIAEAAASTQRRMLGYTPGDRVTLVQLGRDVTRDVVEIDGDRFASVQVGLLMEELCGRVVQALQRERIRQLAHQTDDGTRSGGHLPHGHRPRRLSEPPSSLLRAVTDTSGGVGGWDGAERNGDGAASPVSVPDAPQTGPREEPEMPSTTADDWDSNNLHAAHPTRELAARVVRFCQDVLVCSSRTVVGGDTLEAVELALRHRDHVHIMPDSTAAAPVRIRIRRPEDHSAASVNYEELNRRAAGGAGLWREISPISATASPQRNPVARNHSAPVSASPRLPLATSPPSPSSPSSPQLSSPSPTAASQPRQPRIPRRPLPPGPPPAPPPPPLQDAPLPARRRTNSSINRFSTEEEGEEGEEEEEEEEETTSEEEDIGGLTTGPHAAQTATPPRPPGSEGRPIARHHVRRRSHQPPEFRSVPITPGTPLDPSLRLSQHRSSVMSGRPSLSRFTGLFIDGQQQQHGGSSDSDRLSPVSGLSARDGGDALPMPPLPPVDTLTVFAETAMFYRVKHVDLIDPEDDEELAAGEEGEALAADSDSEPEGSLTAASQDDAASPPRQRSNRTVLSELAREASIEPLHRPSHSAHSLLGGGHTPPPRENSSEWEGGGGEEASSVAGGETSVTARLTDHAVSSQERGGARLPLEWRTGDMAIVAAHFRRAFPWNRPAPSGQIFLSVVLRPWRRKAARADKD